MFPLVRKACVKKMIPIIIVHLACLENIIEKYFASISIYNFNWIHNPFVNLAITNPVSFELCEEE